MKKLMIAAAAVAMIGGAEAVTAEYNFVAYLTTTAGALYQGKTQYTPGSGSVGQNGGTMWYDDAALLTEVDQGAGRVNYSWIGDLGITKYPHLKWDVKDTIGGGRAPTLKIEKDTATGLNLVNEDEAALLARLVGTYNSPSDGMWCAQFAWWVDDSVGQSCYRVFGADNIITTVRLNSDDCCTRGATWERAFKNAGAQKVIEFGTTEFFDDDGRGDAYGCFLKRFGAPDWQNARYIEMYARVANVSTYNAALPFDGWLAGQGQAFEISGVRMPYQVSGTIVGRTDSPKCKDCCSRPDERPRALGFDCLDSQTRDNTSGRTAAYGTFYVQYKGLVD